MKVNIELENEVPPTILSAAYSRIRNTTKSKEIISTSGKYKLSIKVGRKITNCKLKRI